MRISVLILAALLMGCSPDAPSLDFVGIAVGDSAHFTLHTPEQREVAGLTARFVWHDESGDLVLDRIVDLTPDSPGYHAVVSPSTASDRVVRAVPRGASDVSAEVRTLRYADGTSWSPGG